jgi:hypothetical protein
MARAVDSSDGDDWVDVDDESGVVEPAEDDGLSPIEGLVADQLDDVGEMFDSDDDVDE